MKEGVKKICRGEERHEAQGKGMKKPIMRSWHIRKAETKATGGGRRDLKSREGRRRETARGCLGGAGRA